MTASPQVTGTARMKYSLSKKTLIMILVTALLLSVTAILIGYYVYSKETDRHYTENTVNLARTAASILDPVTVGRYTAEVQEIYSSLTPEEKADEDAAYLEKYAHLEQEADWQFLRSQLQIISRENNLLSTLIVLLDEEAHTIIYVLDSDTTETYCPPGTLDDSMTDEEIRSFTGSTAVISNTEEYGWLSSGGTPLYGKDGDILGFAIIDISMDKVMKDKIRFLYSYCGALLLVIAALSYRMLRRMRKNVVAPINKLANAASGYILDQARTDGQTELPRNHFAGLDIHTGDEIENLSGVMADMETKLRDYIENLTKITAEKERIGTELNIATRIQASMLPRVFPPYPDRHEFDLFASMDPAKEVGGDFYDFFLVDDDHLCLVIADVSGKGVPAALFMMASKIIIANNAMTGKSPAQVLYDTNMTLSANGQDDMFVTVWIGILEISTGKLTAANGGHEYPVLTKDGRFELYKDVHSFLVGGMPGMKYKEYELQLEPGEKLFVYTDGVPEAQNSDKKMFGMDRTVEALNESRQGSPEELLRAVRKSVDAFVGDAEQFDDLTMLCLEYRGK